ncbi:hypothetical protein NQZ68_036140 [Dissostichus eleginoides]|nr:hypothetical protein NQZ68_036140 [Dissostichus eleginoides]
MCFMWWAANLCTVTLRKRLDLVLASSSYLTHPPQMHTRYKRCILLSRCNSCLALREDLLPVQFIPYRLG